MKKLSVIALAVAACMLFAIPAMAVDVDFSGYYRVRGFFDDTQSLDDNERTAQAKFDQRFRIQPVFKITDRLTLNTKIEALDRVDWGGDEDSVDLERAWVDAEFDMFTLQFGRMAAGSCGFLYCDSQGDDDRIRVILKGIDPFYLDFTYTKYDENDYDSDNADLDKDGYAVLGAYKAEGMDAGLLIEYVDDKTASAGLATGTAAVWTAAGGAASTAVTPWTNSYSRQYTLINPYFKGVFGMVSVQAEMQWFTGDYADFEDNSAYADVDYDAKRWLLDAAADLDMMTVGLGWAHSDGRSSTEQDMTRANFGGADWEPFLIMTGFFDHSDAGLLGGLGNFNEKNAGLAIADTTQDPRRTTWGDAGFDIFYIYGAWPVMENLTLNAIWGMAQADETSRFGNNVDDDIGWEFDIGAKWQIMDNMAYDVKFGYFKPGDFWKGANGTAFPTKDDDTWSVMHSVVVTF